MAVIKLGVGFDKPQHRSVVVLKGPELNLIHKNPPCESQSIQTIHINLTIIYVSNIILLTNIYMMFTFEIRSFKTVSTYT